MQPLDISSLCTKAVCIGHLLAHLLEDGKQLSQQKPNTNLRVVRGLLQSLDISSLCTKAINWLITWLIAFLHNSAVLVVVQWPGHHLGDDLVQRLNQVCL